MCLATVYKESDDSVIFKNVARIDVDGNKLVLRDIMGDERVVEGSQKLSISKPRIENKNQACYCIDTQMNSNICTVFIVTIHLFQTQIIGKESKMNNTTNR